MGQALKNQNIDCVLYSGISGEPTDQMIYKGLELYQSVSGRDFLVALGGGSPIDSMKAIGALATNGGKISDYMGKTFEKATPPMAAIPTTAGTGSEATQFTIITDTENDVETLLKRMCSHARSGDYRSSVYHDSSAEDHSSYGVGCADTRY